MIGVNFGNCKIIIEDAKEVMGHDDSLPYNAKFSVLIDDEPLFSGSAWNDGWGGTSCYNLDIPKGSDIKKVNENFKFIDELLKENVTFNFMNMTLTLGLLDVIDNLSEIAIHFPECCGLVYDQEPFIKYLEK